MLNEINADDLMSGEQLEVDCVQLREINPRFFQLAICDENGDIIRAGFTSEDEAETQMARIERLLLSMIVRAMEHASEVTIERLEAVREENEEAKVQKARGDFLLRCIEAIYEAEVRDFASFNDEPDHSLGDILTRALKLKAMATVIEKAKAC